jgi:predicted MFS family arabinose efflux permease
LLGALMVMSAITGYQGSIVTQAISFAVDQFGSSKGQQGRALAAIRSDVIITLVLVHLADRLGRRRLLLGCAIAGPFLTALTSLAPNLTVFAATQIVARSVVTATGVLLAVMGVEQMHAQNRGWASSVLVGTAALGTSLLFIPVAFADRSPGFWRVMFLPPLAGLGAVIVAKKYIAESTRFEELEQRRQRGAIDAHFSSHWRRLIIIAAWLIMMGIFSTPARQFLNDFLREEQGLTAKQLTLFGVITNIPGMLGVLFGGAVSDRRGRRFTVGIGLAGYGIASSFMFSSSGSWLWMFAMIASLCGAFALPGLAILVAELFPTSLRSQASGLSTGFNRIGSAIGLFSAGFFADRYQVGPTLSVMAVSMVIGAIIVFVFVPEPAGQELEVLNPEDSTPM